MILLGFAVSGILNTAFIPPGSGTSETVAPRRASGLYCESVTNGKHRQVVNYDVSTLDAQFTKKVTVLDCFTGVCQRLYVSIQIYRKESEKRFIFPINAIQRGAE